MFMQTGLLILVLTSVLTPVHTAGVHHRSLRRVSDQVGELFLLESSLREGTSPTEDTQVDADLHDDDHVDDDDDDDDDDDEDTDKKVNVIDEDESKLSTDPKVWQGKAAMTGAKAKEPVYHVKAYDPPEPKKTVATTTKKTQPPTTTTTTKLRTTTTQTKKSDAQKRHEEALEEAKGALEAAKDKRDFANHKVDSFGDDTAFNAHIDSEVKLMANETQSPVMSGFLGELRQEMRAYAKPTYPTFLEARADKAEKRVKELEGELAKIQGKSNATIAKEAQEKRRKTEAKHGDEEEDDTEDDDESSSEAADAERKAGETWALSFFANIGLLAAIFGMASSKDGLIKNYTWYVIDQVVVIFLAVMYFQAFDALLNFVNVGFSSVVVTSLVHALGLLTLVLVLAHALRSHDLGLAVLCGAGAHVVSFSTMHAASALQNHWVGLSYNWWMCIFGLVVLGLGSALVGYLTYTAKAKAQDLQHRTFMDKTDDLENDVAAMSFSVAWTMFVRFILTDHHPVGTEAEFDHTAGQRLSMLVYAFACLLVAVFSVKFCSKKAAESESYAVKRLMTFFNTVAAMNVAWAFLYWGEWEFFGNLYPGEAIKGRVMFAIIATIVCGLVLIGLAKFPSTEARVNSTGKNDKMVALTALALVCAWSWELCFDAAMEDMTEGVAHPVGMKVVTALVLCAIIVPVYALYMRPITGPAAEAIGA